MKNSPITTIFIFCCCFSAKEKNDKNEDGQSQSDQQQPQVQQIDSNKKLSDDARIVDKNAPKGVCACCVI